MYLLYNYLYGFAEVNMNREDRILSLTVPDCP